MQPGELYILAIVVTALFVAPFNGMARVIVLSWIVAHICFNAGLPEPWANLGGQACVLIIGARHMHSSPALISWLLSISLVVINLLWIAGYAHAAGVWWLILWLAMAQLLVLPLGLQAEAMRNVCKAWYRNEGRGMFKVRAR